MGGYMNWLWALVLLLIAGVVMFIVPGLALIAIALAAVAVIWGAVLAIGAMSGGARSDTELEHDEYLERNPGDAKHMRYDAKS